MDDSLVVFIVLILAVVLAIVVLMYSALWKIYTKAGKNGWAAIVPIYNVIIFLEIIGKPWWWLFLWMIPYLGLIWSIWGWNLMVKSFGKSSYFTFGIFLLPYIFIPILAFGDSRYRGPAGLVQN
jgi:hypothetical protein